MLLAVGLGSTTPVGGRECRAVRAHRRRTLASSPFARSTTPTYFARADGRIACCGRRPQNTYWFSDGYGDYLRSFNWAMAAIPELAPKRQNHLLGSSSVVRPISYGRDRSPTDVRRPARKPAARVPSASAIGGDLTAQPLADGDYIVHVTHTRARS